MRLVIHALYLLCGICFCHGGYSELPDAQSDVEAPAYVPSYLKHQNTGFAGRKTSYAGTKTKYPGTKTAYAGTKTAYPGTKTTYSGTKSVYGEKKTWDTYGQGPTYENFQHSASQGYTAQCVPECKNNGICVATNTCKCPPDFRGKYCEFRKKPCLVYPPLPMNSHRNCSQEFCTIRCMEGHKFIDGSTIANMQCNEGQWTPTRADFTVIPDCMPECSPPCQNGGFCLALNTCQCAEDFRGPKCQYSASACDMRKLAFNGGYSCFGDGEKFSCKLNCPAGAEYSAPRADLYTCLYSTGVFQPQPIPHCVFKENVIVIPTEYHNSSYYESLSWSSHNSGESSSNSGGSYSHTQFGSHGSSEEGGQSAHIVIQDLTPKGSTCLTWAGEHYKTFDGKIYSFASSCQHILVRDAREHKYTVSARAGRCGDRAYCPSELTIYIEEKPYTLSVLPEDGSVVFRSTKRMIPIPASLPGIRVAMPADHVIVNLDAAGLVIKWDTNDIIMIEASILLWNNTEGLCGTLNSYPEDDLVTRENTKAKTNVAMASSWQVNKIGDICEGSPTETASCRAQPDAVSKKALQFCAKIFSKDKFRKCSKVMDVSMLLEACQEDYCACKNSENPEECACSTVSVFAKECLHHGVHEMKNWRDSDTCPKTCPDGKIYQVCGPDNQPSCAFPELSTKVSTCVEGCFCPEGLLLEGGRCVQKQDCPCRLRNRSFKPGSVIPKECNTCTCEAGEWKCSAVPCGARCAAVGDPHYSTFDGLRYDFMGHCTYTLLQAPNVTVAVENEACSGAITEEMNLTPYKGEGRPSCTKSVNLMYDGAQIHLKQGGLILVNGKEVSALPVNVGKIRIRAASSLFVIVQLPFKVDLWWDGHTRVFIDVPPELTGQTKGLCGTFNMNQKDDFLTPEGDVEQSTLAFANKWKTREFCSDVATQEPEHPCKANIENKEAAEKYCGKLKSKLFEECHWYVDVEPYYQACLYDMCACAGDVSHCLCPMLGDYAMTCAKRGVKVQWRYNVKECELQCGGGQEYTVCADSCERTCTDVALAAACRPCCVEGCACPPGQVLDDNNACVPKGLCPCNHKGMKFDAGYKEVRAGRRERELCTCVGARWECQPATQSDVARYPAAEDLRANCSAANHMEFTTCLVADPLTCKNMHLPPSPTSAECRPGCQCLAGYVLDTGAGRCVLPAACPCHHGGRSYPDGHVMKEDCNDCTCQSGNWSCGTRACAGACGAWGDSHLSTFDGAAYDFEGVCTYLLAKGVMDSNDGFDVEIQNVPCGTTGATCSKTTTLKVGGGGNQEIVSLTKDAPLPDTSKLKRIKLRVAGAFVFLDVPSLGMSLQWDRGLRVYVKVDSMWRNRVKGLCGNFNGDLRDDFQTPSGGGLPESSALVFADSWKLKPTCPKPKEVEDYCKLRPERKDWAVSTCGALKRYPFSLCASEVPAAEYMQRCERDACACDAGADCDCACAALAAYAYACALRGVTFNWRSQLMCPMQCDEECSNYDGCMSACPLETCDNTQHYQDVKGTCEQDTCVEGCKPKKPCPEGMVYKNSSLSECVKRAKCRPVCMTLEDGTEVLEGEVLEQDDCHTCRCSKNERVCTGQPCSTVPESTVWTSPKPHDEPLKCVPGWTPWVSVHTPDTDASGASVEREPLPNINDFKIGSPMCSKEMMKQIECRTRRNHELPKQTGLDVECSLEKGLLCKERGGMCPDFEIRVLCECEPFQCMNATQPNHEHPSDCSKFYECTPDMADPSKPHTVLKTCAPGTLYNPRSMVCDWPAAVAAVRPECGATTLGSTTVQTTPTTVGETTVVTEASTEGLCPPGQLYLECAYPCDQLCDYFKKMLQDKGKCGPGERCVEGCVDKSVADQPCKDGSRWRDANTCVPDKDCTCYWAGKLIKPGGIVLEGCEKCQCLANEFHCDTSACSTVAPTRATQPPRFEPIKESTTQSTTPTTSTTQTTRGPTTVPTTPAPIIVVNTASPPPECNPDSYKYLLWGEDVDVKPIFTASSVASPMFEPEYAILDGRPTAVSAGNWAPDASDTSPYIQVELPHSEPLYGVVVQGSPLFDQFVTSYDVMYGDDGHAFSLVSEPDGTPKIFRGPIDNKAPLKQMFSRPVEARYVRLRPRTWHDAPALRLDLIGCAEPLATTPEEVATTAEPLQCTEPLGLGAGLPLDSVEVSSNNALRHGLWLDAPQAWRPLYSTPGEWVMFDFTSPRNLTGIKTKGGADGWVTSYKVMYTSDLSTFNPVLDNAGDVKVFPGNFDGDSVVMNQFKLPIHARYLKVLPEKWKNVIEMRIEPIGCFEPYARETETTPPVELEVTPTTCITCPGVQASLCACSSPDAPYYDGEGCVPRDLCPCVLGYLTYEVGSSFRGENCDECICKLGGITDCKPVKECKCAPTLVPKLVAKPSCECLCEPCPEGTRICPTSKLCLPLSRWCDGLQDCPDDEAECTTAATPTTLMPSTLEPTVVTTVHATVGVTVPPTTPKPIECPVVECPPGYMVKYTSPSSHSRAYTSDLPPPRPRVSYQRYYRPGGYAKGGYSKGGYSKGGYSKGGYSKGGYNPLPPPPTQPNQAFTLDKPSSAPTSAAKKQECPQFRCVPRLPPPPRPGSTPAPVVCSTPLCPPHYTLRLDTVSLKPHECPQYSCVPPPERLSFCNVTERAVSTFDGAEHKYDVCFHILARDTRLDAWSVLVRKKCRVDGCQNELIVHQDDQLIKVKPNLMIEYDNYEYTVEQTAKICFQRNSFDVAKLGDGLAIKSRRYNFTVLYNTDGDIKIGISKQYMGHVDGLCGAFDGSPLNDRRLPDGTQAASSEQMARAWGRPGLPRDACRAKVIDHAKQERVWELCDVITQEPLNKCGKVLSLDKWRNICLEKICKCTDLLVNGTKRTEEECRCLLVEKLVAECLAADKDVDIAAWRMKLNCPAECPPPLVHKDCYRRRCEPTCSTLGAASRECPAEDGQCFPGCYCPEGTLRQGDQCLAPADCLDCECKGTGTPAGYTTFEGDSFPFLGDCTYLASRDANQTGHSYEVYATNAPCEDNVNVTCTKTIHVIYDKKVIQVTRDTKTKKLVTIMGGETVFKYPVKKDWVSVSQLNGQDVSVLLTDAHAEVTVRQAKMELSVRVGSFLYGNRTEGLCGVCAGAHDGLLTSNGTLTDDFEEYGKSWKATPTALATLKIPLEEQQCDQPPPPPPPPPCVPPPKESNPCYNLYNPELFGACHALVEPEPFLEACEEELCSMNSTDVCGSLERYAAACRQHGVCLDWRPRTPHCPYKCSSPLVYRPCVACEETCDNHDELVANPASCRNQPVEGCFCPEGKVRVNNTCIEPAHCFPCDANKEHYAGDEWQESACEKCTCSRVAGSNAARVACTTQTCSAPVCAPGEDLLARPKPPGDCCDQYMCVPKPQAQCKEPKQMECGFGQVLKQKTTPSGCKEFSCECMPASECEHIPTDSEVELEPGLQRLVDSSGCCPRLQMLCRRETCPQPPACPRFHSLKTVNVTGKCCDQYECELPKDKCVVTLEWEAGPRGGEKARAKPEEILKDVDESWLDGPCRRCRCVSSPRGPAAECSTTECPVARARAFVLEPRPVPFACCPALVPVACRDAGDIYRVGENWTSPYDVCETYSCVEVEEGKLEKVTTVKSCDTTCQPGWKYFPAEPASKQCCGRCKPVACVCGDDEHRIGERWTSPDFCTNYTCVDLNGTLQVQSVNESCPEISAAERKQFVLSDEPVPGRCCRRREPVACRVGNHIYQEGQTWPSSDPCKNLTCARDVTGRLTQEASVQTCSRDCRRGWAYRDPPPGACCGRCEQAQCVDNDRLVEPGTTWKSDDNCTTFSCEKSGDDLVVTSARQACPDVSACRPEDLVDDACCQRCREKPQDLKRCAPVALTGLESLRVVRARLRPHGDCYNDAPLAGFYECRGSCDSGTLYNNVTGVHDSKCECCSATRYSALDVWLACADGSRQLHRVATPAACACAACAGAPAWRPGTGYNPTKTGTKGGYNNEPDVPDYDIPEIYQRMRIPENEARRR